VNSTALYHYAEHEDSVLSCGTVDANSEGRAAAILVLFVGNYKRARFIDLYWHDGCSVFVEDMLVGAVARTL
jgi:hypothetical protein